MQHQVTDGVINAKYTIVAQRSVMGDQNGGSWGFHLSKHGHIHFHLPNTYKPATCTMNTPMGIRGNCSTGENTTDGKNSENCFQWH
jgi:hypothetical protein